MLRDEIGPMLRSNGWKGSGKNYSRSSELYRAFIIFQKNRWNTKDEVKFTADLGVLSDEAIAERQAEHLEARQRWGPDVVVIPTWGQWSTRLGHLLPPPKDRQWWRLLTGRPPERTVGEVLDAISTYGLPVIERQMERPSVQPSAVIERPGELTGRHFMPNGDIRWHNVGGERLYRPTRCPERSAHEFEPPEPRAESRSTC